LWHLLICDNTFFLISLFKMRHVIRRIYYVMLYHWRTEARSSPKFHLVRLVSQAAEGVSPVFVTPFPYIPVYIVTYDVILWSGPVLHQVLWRHGDDESLWERGIFELNETQVIARLLVIGTARHGLSYHHNHSLFSFRQWRPWSQRRCRNRTATAVALTAACDGPGSHTHFYKSAPVIMKTGKSWCLRCGLTDFNETWYVRCMGRTFADRCKTLQKK